jgi:hypothetical protein
MVLHSNSILDVISQANGNLYKGRIIKGIYEIGHFGSSYFPRRRICKFVISFTRVLKSNQPSAGGWRWHKWGPYMGTQNSQREYLHDEPSISEIFCYHIMEKVT